jgi:membrane-associated phospholipid phosphatase
VVKKHLTSEGYLGWHLVAGFLVFAGMTLVLGEIADDVMRGEPLTLTDAQLSRWVQMRRSSSLTAAFQIITYFGSTLAVSLIAIVMGFYLLRRHQRYWFTVTMVSIFGGIILNRMLKLAFQRARPQFDDPIFSYVGYSFPSGHTMTATVVYGTIAVFLVAKTKHLGLRVVVMLSASLLIAMVGFSRIYLGAHYLSDVLAAIAEGLAWLSLCFTLSYWLWRHRHRTRQSGALSSR